MQQDHAHGKQPVADSTTLKQPLALSALALTVLPFLLPIYAKHLGASAVSIGALFTVAQFMIVLGRPVVGWAVDRYGYKPFFVASVIGYAAAMAMFALAVSVSFLYLGQLMHGLATALMWTSTYAATTVWSSPDTYGKVVGRVDEYAARGGIWGMLIALACVSVFALSIAWRIVFFIYAGLALIGAGLACARAPKTAPSSHQLSGKRQAVFSWLFVRLVGVIFLSHFITALLRPVFYVFLQDRFTTDVRLLTLAFIPAALIESFLPSRLGRLSDRWGRTPLIIAGLGGSGLLSFAIPTASHLVWVILYWTLQTLALMAAVPPQKALVSDLTEQEDRGLGYGMYTFAASLGTALGPLLGGWSYDHLGHGVPFYLNGIALLTNPVWIFFLLRTPPRQQAA